MIHDMIDQASYMAHGYCLLWKPWLVTIHAGSDLIIFASYFAIPIGIWLFIRKRKDFELKSLAILFAAFIFFCGMTHMVQAVTLWWPIYETQGYLKVATAIASVATAIMIFPLIPRALAIPSPSQLRIVNEGLAAEVSAHRLTLAELEKARDELELRVAERTKELEHSKARFEALVRASAQVVWTYDAKAETFEDSPSWRLFTGQSPKELKGSGWLDAIHPDDRSRTLAAWREALQTQRMYSVEYRLRHAPSGWRWTAAKAIPLASGNGDRREWVGMNTDIDERRRSEDHMQFVMKELSHRTKNLLTVIFSMARQTARHRCSRDFIADFGERIQGLSRSHDLLVSTNWMGAPLDEHLRAQLRPFTALDSRQIRFSGPRLMLKPAATQALGLAFHELATNAAKHGALKRPDGRIQVTWGVETKEGIEVFRLLWREESQSPEPLKVTEAGFGYTVLTRVVPDALSGEVKHRLDKGGISWEIEAPLCEVVASSDTGCAREILDAGRLDQTAAEAAPLTLGQAPQQQ